MKETENSLSTSFLIFIKHFNMDSVKVTLSLGQIFKIIQNSQLIQPQFIIFMKNLSLNYIWHHINDSTVKETGVILMRARQKTSQAEIKVF
jgi:hypothetical protein